MQAKKVTIDLCNKCNFELAKINGRTLKFAINVISPNVDFGYFSLTEWVNVCPRCNAYALGIELIHPFPFMCTDGVMRTAEEVDWELNQYKKFEVLDFAGFKFSKSALESSIGHIQNEDESTKSLENFGLEINKYINHEKLLEFSRLVCEWGRGQRVWANLKRHNDLTVLAIAYEKWFEVIMNDNPSDEKAILLGTKIKGLGISFASKHLRMLMPEKYAVLDNVLSEGLGFALNAKGFRLFMTLLRNFSGNYNKKYNSQYSVADIEAGIFFLVRQDVRSLI